MTSKRFIVYLACDIPADGGPLACGTARHFV